MKHGIGKPISDCCVASGIPSFSDAATFSLLSDMLGPCDTAYFSSPHFQAFGFFVGLRTHFLEWDTAGNGGRSLDSYSKGSHELVCWIYSKCGEPFKAHISDRAKDKGATGCPFCSGRKPRIGKNDLATLYPDLMRQRILSALRQFRKKRSNDAGCGLSESNLYLKLLCILATTLFSPNLFQFHQRSVMLYHNVVLLFAK